MVRSGFGTFRLHLQASGPRLPGIQYHAARFQFTLNIYDPFGEQRRFGEPESYVGPDSFDDPDPFGVKKQTRPAETGIRHDYRYVRWGLLSNIFGYLVCFPLASFVFGAIQLQANLDANTVMIGSLVIVASIFAMVASIIIASILFMAAPNPNERRLAMMYVGFHLVGIILESIDKFVGFGGWMMVLSKLLTGIGMFALLDFYVQIGHNVNNIRLVESGQQFKQVFSGVLIFLVLAVFLPLPQMGVIVVVFVFLATVLIRYGLLMLNAYRAVNIP